ncbi:MAG TPA: hypothetical protein VNT25_04385, partial [Allosphingosinicella sp.]|nr:hypothetical protein [Allosphingosinicella sp.]
QIAFLFDRYRRDRNGLTPFEANDIERRIEQLRERVDHARREDRRDRRDRWDDDFDRRDRRW